MSKRAEPLTKTKEVERVPTGLAAHVDIEQVRPARYDGAPHQRPWRTVPVHLRLFRKGRLTPAELVWCEAFAGAWERCPRYRTGWPRADGRGGHADLEPSEAALYAARFVQRTSEAAGEHFEFLVGAIVEGYRICDLAVMIGLKPGDDETMVAFSNRVGPRVEDKIVKLIQSRCRWC
jgi:hypothetical protein